MRPKEKKYKMPPKAEKNDFTDPNMRDEHQHSPVVDTAPFSDNFNDGTWASAGAKFIRARCADEEGGYNLPTICVPDDPDDYSN